MPQPGQLCRPKPSSLAGHVYWQLGHSTFSAMVFSYVVADASALSDALCAARLNFQPSSAFLHGSRDRRIGPDQRLACHLKGDAASWATLKAKVRLGGRP
jgi:hypothetical protein